MSSPVHSVSVAWCLWNFHFPSSPSCLLIPFSLSFPSCDEYHMMGGGRVVRDLGRKRERERDHDDHRIGMKLSNYIPWLIPNRFHIHFQFYNFTVFVSVSLVVPLLLEFLILSLSLSLYFLLPNSSFSSIPVHFCLFLPQPSHASLTWWNFMISIVRRDRKLWNCSILICNREGKICERGAKINCGNVYVRKNGEREMESEVGKRGAKSCWAEQGMRKRETKWEARLEKRDNFITFHFKLLHYFLQFTTSIKNLRGKRKHGAQKYDYSFAANFRCIFSRFESEFLKEKDVF